MQAILQRQISSTSVGASALNDTSKKIEDLQRSQAKDNDQIIKSLTDLNGTGLNSNVVRLFKEIKKVSDSVEKRGLNPQEAGGITDKVTGRRQFNTLKPRVDSFKEGAKDFFTMRGFLDKTGIVKRGSGGILSEYLDRGEAKKKYIDSRLKLDPTAKLHGADKAREIFGKQFDKQQDLQYGINKNEKALKAYRDQGFTDKQIERTSEFKRRGELATEIAKVDTRLRPEGFDPKTGKIKEPKPETATEQQAKAKSSGKVIPFTGGSSDSGSLGNEETMLEQNRMVAEQSELLTKIEENTRSLKGGTKGQGTTQKPEREEAGGLGLMDMLGMGKLGGIAKTAGRGLMTGARALGGFALRRAGPLAAAAAVATGAYEGYKGWTAAGDKEEKSKKDIEAKVASGEITEEQAQGLRKEAGETATVEKGESAGKGTGMAIGGAAGALKGAALGAAIGSVVPVVGTVVGGAIGATVGAIGGAWAGGKAGGWLGKQAGKATNWVKSFFGGNKDESNAREAKADGSSTSIEFSESQFAEKDPDNYAKFNEFRNKLVEEYAQKQAKKFKHDKPTPDDYKVAKMKADKEAVVKFKKEIEAIGAGKVTGGKKELGDTTKEAVKGAADGITPKAGEQSGVTSDQVVNNPAYKKEYDARIASGASDYSARKSAGMASRADLAKRGVKGEGAETAKALKDMTAAGATPTTGDAISKASGDNEQAKLDAGKGAGSTAIVNAPSVTTNKTVQNNQVKLSPRNTDTTVNRYLERAYA